MVDCPAKGGGKPQPTIVRSAPKSPLWSVGGCSKLNETFVITAINGVLEDMPSHDNICEHYQKQWTATYLHSTCMQC